jgi:hypothetical protein
MLRRIAALCLAIGLAHSASAATLSVASDKLTYSVGEPITLTVSGDPEGAFAYSIFGRLDYSGALVDNGTRTQITLVPTQGTWVKGFLEQGDDGVSAHSSAFNQIPGPFAHADTVLNLPADNPFATVTLIATAVGLVDVSWSTTQFYQLSFFGLTSAPGTSFEIVPEPGTASLLGLGLMIFAWRRRKH